MVVTLVGYLALFYILAKVLSYFSKYVQGSINPKSLGDWAVVTGATDGIGKGFCIELAKRGVNIVLVSRTKSKLEDVSKEIEDKYKVKTKIIDIDFTQDKDAQSRIEEETKGLTVGLLINNVGMSYDHPEYFLQIENGETRCQALIDCNISSMLNVTRAILPTMVARRKGAIINMSSYSAHCAPLLSVYGASKAFVIQWTKDMEIEYKGQGINLMCAAPYFVVSNMSKIRKASLTTPTAGLYASSVLAQLGTTSFTYGYWTHDIVAAVMSLLGPFGPMLTMNVLKTVRGKALKKKEKAAMEKKD